MNRKFVGILASLVILLCGIVLWRTFRPIPDKFDPTLALTAGQVLAEETAKAIQEKGRVMVVLSEMHQAPSGTAATEWQAFRSELKEHPAIELAGTEVPVNPEGLPEFSSAAFQKILTRHAQMEAIVVLHPLPAWSRLQLRKKTPTKVLALGPVVVVSKEQLAGYFTHDLLTVLICPRWEASTGRVANPQTPRERFYNAYQILTPQNFESLPD